VAGAGLATESPSSTMGPPVPGSRTGSFSAPVTASGTKDGGVGVTVDMLERLNVAQAAQSNQEYLESLGGIKGLAALLGVDLRNGLTEEQARALRGRFGSNVFPSPPMASWIELFVDALKVRPRGCARGRLYAS
jgi:hypothetical protein